MGADGDAEVDEDDEDSCLTPKTFQRKGYRLFKDRRYLFVHYWDICDARSKPRLPMPSM